MKASAVVTVVGERQGRIALFERSWSVGAYAGSWAGSSGYLEGAPLEHFQVELACLKSADRPVYFLAEKRKLLLGDVDSAYETHAPAEVWGAAPKNLKLLNNYFDRTPARCSSGMVLASGVATSAYQIRRLAAEIPHRGVE